MPFKGDMRLGGRHSNVASLNGTASDIVSVPAYGTVLSGPTDTSRYENDYNGTPFYMPYSTTVYADGLGGQTSVETWGLQYYPAGWVTGTTSVDKYANWDYSTQDNAYNTQGSVLYGTEQNNNVEDGTGINYLSPTGINYLVSAGQTVAIDTANTPDRWRVVINSLSNGTDFEDYTVYPVFGTNLGGGSSGSNNVITPCSTISAGSWGNPDNFADGYGGSYNDGSAYSNYDTYPSGSFLQECNGQYLYSDGGGGYTTGFAPLGWPVSTSSSASLHWQSPNFAVDGVEGDFTYTAGGCSGTADGSGGMNNQICGGWGASLGDPIVNGTYYYSQGDGTFQEDGTTEVMQNHTVIWSYTYDGGFGYNSNISDTYVLS